MTPMVSTKNQIQTIYYSLAMYAGKLKQNIPTGPGTFFRKNDNNVFIGEWMGAKSDGKTRWSYG